MNIVVLAGGVGGSTFAAGLLDALGPGDSGVVTIVVNVGDDIWLNGLRVCPDLDTVMYRLAGVGDDERGWGRPGDSGRVAAELSAYGLGTSWFTVGDLDIATHLARTRLLTEGWTLSEATAALCSRWDIPAAIIPATDEPDETLVRLRDGRTVHFQEWWVRMRASEPAAAFGRELGSPPAAAPGVLAAVRDADVVVFAPSNPVVSIGRILEVRGVRDAIATTGAVVVGVSPIIGDAPVRGMADQCLSAIGVDCSAAGVARHYGARSDSGLLDGWLLDTVDRDAVAVLAASGITAEVAPLLMTDADAARELARRTLVLALSL
ncbi:2-phospho-L-lactate transferase [Leifsonia sp. Leaf336]|uniref:2-phospho-L-lactate transferase n=1 Tax=Leifsonia sp. Leaf336 TaxID=1736341 RepID=UPI0006FA7177|nr:2-phospho-L-lactate transferase [Leifsonia sp. Leaf336]KQR50872.1 2-phospho-L-lactate transferase [Leifsonia sp. Leaf336]